MKTTLPLKRQGLTKVPVKEEAMATEILAEVEYRSLEAFGYEGYRVGSDGTVWTQWQSNRWQPISGEWRQLRQRKAPRYFAVDLTKRPECVRVKEYVHRLVLLAFSGPCPEGLEACHYPDRDITNNNASNLRWDTHLANTQDKQTHGTQTRGESHGTSRLNNTAVREIREAFSHGTRKYELAKKYGVAQGTIKAVLDGRTWAHVA